MSTRQTVDVMAFQEPALLLEDIQRHRWRRFKGLADEALAYFEQLNLDDIPRITTDDEQTLRDLLTTTAVDVEDHARMEDLVKALPRADRERMLRQMDTSAVRCGYEPPPMPWNPTGAIDWIFDVLACANPNRRYDDVNEEEAAEEEAV